MLIYYYRDNPFCNDTSAANAGEDWLGSEIHTKDVEILKYLDLWKLGSWSQLWSLKKKSWSRMVVTRSAKLSGPHVSVELWNWGFLELRKQAVLCCAGAIAKYMKQQILDAFKRITVWNHNSTAHVIKCSNSSNTMSNCLALKHGWMEQRHCATSGWSEQIPAVVERSESRLLRPNDGIGSHQECCRPGVTESWEKVPSSKEVR